MPMLVSKTVPSHRPTAVTLSLDLRDVESALAPDDVVRDLTANLSELAKGGVTRVAIVAREKRVSLGVARQLQEFAAQVGVEALCFLDEHDATVWAERPIS